MPSNTKHRDEKRATRKQRNKQFDPTKLNFDKPRFSPRETCEYCGNIFSEYSLRRSRTTGLLLSLPAPEYLRIGNRICYEKSVIDAWLDEYAVRQSNTAQNVA